MAMGIENALDWFFYFKGEVQPDIILLQIKADKSNN